MSQVGGQSDESDVDAVKAVRGALHRCCGCGGGAAGGVTIPLRSCGGGVGQKF